MGKLKRHTDGWVELSQVEKDQFKETFGKIPKTEQINLEIKTLFADGMCSRTGKIPAGAIFVGRVHLQEQLQILSSGKIWLYGDDSVEEYVGPCVFKGEVGSQRLVQVLEDAVWTTVLKTSALTAEDAEIQCTVGTLEEYKARLEHVCDGSSDGGISAVRGEP